MQRYAAGRTIMALILREMSTRYGKTPGGYVWALVEPLGMIAVLSIGFSLLLRSPSLGTSFILFYATGFLIYNFAMSIATTTGKSISFSKSLLFYPRVTWIDAIIARFLLNTLTAALVAYILIAVILWYTGTRTVIDMVVVLQAVGMAAVLGLGIGCLNCFLIHYFPVWDTIWSIATRPLFILSGVIYIYEDLPPLAQNILWYNPLLHITGQMRKGFYPIYDATYVAPLYVLMVGLIAMALGLLLLRRHHKELINL